MNYSLLASGLISSLVLIIASLFSFLETSIVAISPHKLKILRHKFWWANCAYRLKQQLNQVLIFSLFGNSLFNAVFTTFTTVLVSSALIRISNHLVLPLTTLCIAFIIIIISEAVPKTIAAKAPLVTIKIISIPLYYIFIICKPIIFIIDKIVHGITKFLNLGDETTSIEELKAIISDKASPFKESHLSILLNSMDLQSITVKEVLIALRMVEAIDINDNIDKIYKQIYTTHHTRIIVYENTLENIIGFIHVKDIVALANKEAFSQQYIKEILRPISFIHDFVPVVRQISIAQKERQRIFAVINEYGDVIGIACLEDMLEMIFGDFTTEAPGQKDLVKKNQQDQFIVDGTMLIRELNELYNLQIQTDAEALTINGLVLKTLNGIPNIGVCFRLNDLVFEVISVGEYWVERVKITQLNLDVVE